MFSLLPFIAALFDVCLIKMKVLLIRNFLTTEGSVVNSYL